MNAFAVYARVKTSNSTDTYVRTVMMLIPSIIKMTATNAKEIDNGGESFIEKEKE